MESNGTNWRLDRAEAILLKLSEAQDRLAEAQDRAEKRLEGAEARLDRTETSLEQSAARLEQSAARLDRIEAGLEQSGARLDHINATLDRVAITQESLGRFQRVVDEGIEHLLSAQKHLFFAQGVLQDEQAKTDAAIRKLSAAQDLNTEQIKQLREAQREAQKHTDERLNALISIVDGMIRKPPPN